MNAENATRRLDQFERALARLDEALSVPETAPLAIDGTIQRFEFTFELCWKAMKAVLEVETSTAALGTARAVIKEAYAAGWIDDENGWLDLLRMRNETSHIYNETAARSVYLRIRKCAPLMAAALKVLRAQLGRSAASP
jgi:nucleotidyltransferase substrate binding protein (TIGR01987 family)